MAFAKVYSAQTALLKPTTITVEVDLLKGGVQTFAIVGLPDKAVEESRDRVCAAIKNSGFRSPKKKSEKVVVSLAPADIKKEGPSYDLAVALAYLLADNEIRFKPRYKLFLGELALNGDIRGIKGTLPLVIHARKNGFEEVYIPQANANEAAVVENIQVYPVNSLREVIDHLNEKKGAEKVPLSPAPKKKISYKKPAYMIDFGDIKGQESAKRGLEIAASGGHNVAMTGPPGTGKTMLAKAFVGILPPLDFNEVLEVTSIHSVAGNLEGELITHPPYRAPHHTASHVALVGGGSIPRPGEITLAHRGVLFLDEFPEFDRRVIESLRQPLEEGVVSVSRAKGSALFPANIILITAMNPCPCGNWGSESLKKKCVCTPGQLMHYRRKISGPMVDRIDMWLHVGAVDHKKLNEVSVANESDAIRKKVTKSRKIQNERFQNVDNVSTNSGMGVKELQKFITLDENTLATLNSAAKRLDLSARAYHRVIKLAQTIADLAGSDGITDKHIMEAISYRPKESSYV